MVDECVFPVQQTAYFVSQLLLIVMGLYVAGVRSIGIVVERLGKHLWAIVKPHATKHLRGSGPMNMLFAGMFWGLVPCGMVYAVLSIALVSGGAVQGALLMLAFGLGTLPNLMLLGVSGQWFARLSKRRFRSVIGRPSDNRVWGHGAYACANCFSMSAFIAQKMCLNRINGKLAIKGSCTMSVVWV